jgi:DNA-directed RNA polymerase subunit RPC12/RpoP
MFEKHSVELTCPACGHKFQEQLGRLEKDPTIDCPGCHSPIEIKAQGLRDGLKKVDRAMADLQKTLKGLGKR